MAFVIISVYHFIFYFFVKLRVFLDFVFTNCTLLRSSQNMIISNGEPINLIENGCNLIESLLGGGANTFKEDRNAKVILKALI